MNIYSWVKVQKIEKQTDDRSDSNKHYIHLWK